MSSKRGRKCSIKTCDNYQHTHKHLSFFRFPKDNERCRTWIANTKRFDLLDKINIHDERICQQHFEPIMFLNESQNRLQQYAIPSLYLTTKPPPIQPPPMTFNGFPAEKLFNNAIVDAAAALLYQNNLTITPVYSKPKPIQTESFSEPMNLSTSQNGAHSFNDTTIYNVSDASNGFSSNSQQMLTNLFSNGTKSTPSPIIDANMSEQYKNTISNTNTNATLNNGGFRRPRQVFTLEQENQLADYVRETSNYYSGLSSKEVRIMAFVYGVCNQVEMPPGWHESHQASFDWCVGFIKRTKLPPQMITGISTKGSNKQPKVSASIETKPNKTSTQINNNFLRNTGNNIDANTIEID